MIKRDIYVTNRRRVEPISVVYGADAVGIELTIVDFNLPAGNLSAEAHARAKNSSITYRNDCSIAENKITFYPAPNFFQPGYNLLQLDVTASGRHVLSFVIDAICDPDVVQGAHPVTPEEVKPLVEIITKAAKEAKDSADIAVKVAENTKDDYLEIEEDTLIVQTARLKKTQE